MHVNIDHIYFASVCLSVTKIFFHHHFYNKCNLSGQVTLGQVRSGHVRSDQVRSGQVRSRRVKFSFTYQYPQKVFNALALMRQILLNSEYLLLSRWFQNYFDSKIKVFYIQAQAHDLVSNRCHRLFHLKIKRIYQFDHTSILENDVSL